MLFFLTMLMFMLYFVFMLMHFFRLVFVFVLLCHSYHLVLIINIIGPKDSSEYNITEYCYILNTFP